ncbi:MAG TPA: hypothetical protein VK335_01675 [Bryobacteraceae bacterium]|nr:hypothetical protein [Bryobacteraceae bacterium]
MIDRNELVRRLVLNAICDDYENVDQVILRDVAQDGAKLGLTLERSDVVEALASLVRDGLAKAYLLSAFAPYSTELQGMPPLDVVEEYFKTYFYITKEGMDLHLSDDSWWPFDEDGRPLR